MSAPASVAVLTVCAALFAGCGGPPAPAREPAPAARAATNVPRRSEPGAPPSPDALADWAACDIGVLGLALWIAVPRGAAIDRDPDVCIVTPRRGAQIEDAEWFMVVGGVSDADARSTPLAIEPDGARRFLRDEAELDDAVVSIEGELELLGARARYYGLRSDARERGARGFVAARVRMRGGWLVGVAGTRDGDSHLEALARTLALARSR